MTHAILASRLDSLVRERPTRTFGSGGGARASFQWVESQKKNLHLRFLRRVNPFDVQ